MKRHTALAVGYCIGFLVCLPSMLVASGLSRWTYLIGVAAALAYFWVGAVLIRQDRSR